MKDFVVSKIYSYTGPNYYLDKRALVFNLYLVPDGPEVDHYKSRILEKFPDLDENYPNRVADLFAEVFVRILKMDMDLYIGKYNISRDADEWIIAIEYLDEHLSRECLYFLQDWFRSMNDNDESFTFNEGFEDLQAQFDKTLYGGPTIYSLIEGGVIRGIPVNYLYEENQFMWGYGKKQIRGRSTIIHTDGIKDTEFTSYKDMVGEWLERWGFPTPKAINCFTLEEAIESAEEIGFPCVVKPVAGHKGQGVTTGIESMEEVKKAFLNITKAAEDEGVAFEGALVQQMIFGYDHRILCVGGKYSATLKRIPAYVVGDGKNTIEKLIGIENSKEVRIDNARSPLAKIKIDEDLLDFLSLQGKTINTIPEESEEVVLRRVANISAGGVSINVTNEIHQDNIDMVENISKFFNVTAMGIDVLAADISKPWTDGNFGIIEINAGPGIFMHLAPAEGGSVDVPGILMAHLFGDNGEKSRIPIIAGNDISSELFEKIVTKIQDIKPNIEYGSLRKDGVYFNNKFFTQNKFHDENCKVLFRNPKIEVAILNHNADDIHDFGIWHEGLDIAILQNASYAEYVLMRDLRPGGLLIEFKTTQNEEGVEKLELILTRDMSEIQTIELTSEDDIDHSIFTLLVPYLEEVLKKYD